MQDRTKNVLMLIAYGTEEMEAVTIADIIRRAGLSLTIAGESQIVTCSQGVKIIPDALLDDVLEEDAYDAVVIPGGGRGVESLSGNPQAEKLLRANFERGAVIGAICAAPLLLGQFGILQDIPSVKITSHPSVETILRHTTAANYCYDKVVCSAGIVTSRGAGTAIEFALAVIRLLYGADASEKVALDIEYFGSKSSKTIIESSQEIQKDSHE